MEKAVYNSKKGKACRWRRVWVLETPNGGRFLMALLEDTGGFAVRCRMRYPDGSVHSSKTTYRQGTSYRQMVGECDQKLKRLIETIEAVSGSKPSLRAVCFRRGATEEEVSEALRPWGF